MGARFRFEAEVWEHDGPASWFFVSLPDDVADEIEERYAGGAGGFGSIRVEVTVGTSTWRTSLFPDSRRRTYLLPLKAPVRRAEGLRDGSLAEVDVKVLADPAG